MALIKEKQIKGYNASYWRIIQFSANFNRSDAVVTISLYKDEATRLTDPEAVLETISFDLGPDFHNGVYTGSEDTIKNVKLKEAYTLLKSKAQTENAKTEDKNEQLAFFADAING